MLLVEQVVDVLVDFHGVVGRLVGVEGFVPGRFVLVRFDLGLQLQTQHVILRVRLVSQVVCQERNRQNLAQLNIALVSAAVVEEGELFVLRWYERMVPPVGSRILRHPLPQLEELLLLVLVEVDRRLWLRSPTVQDRLAPHHIPLDPQRVATLVLATR